MSTYTDILKKYGIESTPGQSGASSDSGNKQGARYAAAFNQH